jgi:hypothetical protein
MANTIVCKTCRKAVLNNALSIRAHLRKCQPVVAQRLHEEYQARTDAAKRAALESRIGLAA